MFDGGVCDMFEQQQHRITHKYTYVYGACAAAAPPLCVMCYIKIPAGFSHGNSSCNAMYGMWQSYVFLRIIYLQCLSLLV